MYHTSTQTNVTFDSKLATVPAAPYTRSANAEDKRYIKEYLGSDGHDIAWDFIRAAMFSAARTSIFMMQVGVV